LALVDSEWRALMALLDGLSEEEMTQPGAVGHWSARDLLCHIASWEEEFIKAAPIILAGKPLPGCDAACAGTPGGTTRSTPPTYGSGANACSHNRPSPISKPAHKA
jgi:hypothetical protein